jgi:hypothetical protein
MEQVLVSSTERFYMRNLLLLLGAGPVGHQPIPVYSPSMALPPPYQQLPYGYTSQGQYGHSSSYTGQGQHYQRTYPRLGQEYESREYQGAYAAQHRDWFPNAGSLPAAPASSWYGASREYSQGYGSSSKHGNGYRSYITFPQPQDNGHGQSLGTAGHSSSQGRLSSNSNSNGQTSNAHTNQPGHPVLSSRS